LFGELCRKKNFVRLSYSLNNIVQIGNVGDTMTDITYTKQSTY